MDGDGGQYYEPIMMPGMHPGHRNFPPLEDVGGGFGQAPAGYVAGASRHHLLGVQARVATARSTRSTI